MADITEKPPNKKIKGEQEFIGLIDDCYRLKFNENQFEGDNVELMTGIRKIRDTLERAQSSGDVPFGPTRFSSKITWGKCLYLMLESGPESFKALKVLNRLSPGGGLL